MGAVLCPHRTQRLHRSESPFTVAEQSHPPHEDKHNPKRRPKDGVESKCGEGEHHRDDTQNPKQNGAESKFGEGDVWFNFADGDDDSDAEWLVWLSSNEASLRSKFRRLVGAEAKTHEGDTLPICRVEFGVQSRIFLNDGRVEVPFALPSHIRQLSDLGQGMETYSEDREYRAEELSVGVDGAWCRLSDWVGPGALRCPEILLDTRK